jgi:hypothetical protein
MHSRLWAYVAVGGVALPFLGLVILNAFVAVSGLLIFISASIGGSVG